MQRFVFSVVGERMYSLWEMRRVEKVREKIKNSGRRGRHSQRGKNRKLYICICTYPF
jgi:hypothetical protein